MARVATAMLLGLALAPVSGAHAQWSVGPARPEGAAVDVTVARLANEGGHALEVYRDGSGAVRARFTLPPGLTELDTGLCPTLQVDRWAPTNRSIDQGACLANARWAEYVVGTVANQRIASERLFQFMNGNQVVFRYRLAGGDYRETAFSLSGSKRALTGAIGADVTIATP